MTVWSAARELQGKFDLIPTERNLSLGIDRNIAPCISQERGQHHDMHHDIGLRHGESGER